MPRFVILYHDCPRDRPRPSHWDFLLENGDRLRAFALLEEPIAGRAIEALPLADHRLDYLDYEGPVSGDRGTVRRWDQGDYELITAAADHLIVDLDGHRIHGRCELARDQEHLTRWHWITSPAKS